MPVFQTRLIHVQSLHGAIDWRDGIAVRWDRLIPLANPFCSRGAIAGGTDDAGGWLPWWALKALLPLVVLC